MVLNNKFLRYGLIAIISIIIIFVTPGTTFSQEGIDPWCQNLGACDGYTQTILEAKSGSDLFEVDSKVVLTPRGATYDTSIPFCSIYEYDSRGDDDAAWECTWEEFDSTGGDAYLFTLKSINARHQTDVYIKAVAGVIDTNVFQVNENWRFSTSSGLSRANVNNPPGSITLISVDSYVTNSDDDFTFMAYEYEDNFYAHTFFGNSGSYISGRFLNITPPSSMFLCQDYIRVNNQRSTWDSRNSTCGDLSYSRQYPLVVPSIYVYRSLEDYVDKDFGVEMNSFGIQNNSNSTWATLDVSMENGNEDSLVWYQMSIIGYR